MNEVGVSGEGETCGVVAHSSKKKKRKEEKIFYDGPLTFCTGIIFTRDKNKTLWFIFWTSLFTFSFFLMSTQNVLEIVSLHAPVSC